MDKSFDNLFSNVKQLTWLPWVGDNYSSANRRILIVAESHYCNTEDSIKRAEDIREMIKDRDYTREVVQECPIDQDWFNSMFDNLHKTFFLNESFDSSAFWESIAFYNFVQRPMDYSIKERPNENDFYQGWSVFLSIIDILKPTDCIFVGVAASDYFSQSMAMLGVDCSPIEWLEGQGAYARRFSISRDWGTITPLCIKHTSKYYSYDYWHSFLLTHNKTALKYIYSIQGLQLNLNYGYHSDTSDQSWLDDIPVYLKHKPILACNYYEIEEEGSDAYYLTLGRAQYDNENGASVKVWRYSDNGGRWSRQSEEVPINRISDMALMLVSAIKTFNTLDYSTGFTYLNEAFKNEDDMPFIQRCISADAPRIRKSLSELKRLLNEIDLDAIH